jgi:hypothetical protein
MGPDDMPTLADLIGRVIVQRQPPEDVAPDVTGFRWRFRQLHYVR